MDLAHELDHINEKGYGWFQENLGEAVIWFEYDAVNSEYDNVYDEPSLTETRVWRPGIIVPALWVNELEDTQRSDGDAKRIISSLRLAVPVKTFREVGLSSPLDTRRHLNDLIVYRRNYWTVAQYTPRGRMRDSAIVGISAAQVNTDDMPFDTLPSFAGLDATDRPKGFPSDGFAGMTFPEHELPAHQAP